MKSGELRFQVNPGNNLQYPVSVGKKPKKLGVVVLACHSSYGGKHKRGIRQSRPSWAKSETPSQK
jgi:hypothetical protein